jgi:membrane-bound metal-dependent hydrolase YbcI (DUF457 family)
MFDVLEVDLNWLPNVLQKANLNVLFNIIIIFYTYRYISGPKFRPTFINEYLVKYYACQIMYIWVGINFGPLFGKIIWSPVLQVP